MPGDSVQANGVVGSKVTRTFRFRKIHKIQRPIDRTTTLAMNARVMEDRSRTAFAPRITTPPTITKGGQIPQRKRPRYHHLEVMHSIEDWSAPANEEGFRAPDPILRFWQAASQHLRLVIADPNRDSVHNESHLPRPMNSAFKLSVARRT